MRDDHARPPGEQFAERYLERGFGGGADRRGRLSRSLQDLLAIVETVRAKGAGFRSLAKDIDKTTRAGRLVFHVFASITHFERDRISERTKEGLVARHHKGESLKERT